jgi:cytochrome P450
MQVLTSSVADDKYGPVVRFAPNDISYIKSSAWKEIYANRVAQSGEPLMRDRKYMRDMEQFGAWNLLVADPPNHARQRKQLAPAFSEKALREQEPLIMRYINHLMERLAETAGQAVDLSGLFNFATFDIVGEVCSGFFHHLRTITNSS